MVKSEKELLEKIKWWRQSEIIVIESKEILVQAFKQWAAEYIEACRAEEKKDAWMDENSVMKRLGKSRPTLWRWNKYGYLKCYKVGGKNCYKVGDIEQMESNGRA